MRSRVGARGFTLRALVAVLFVGGVVAAPGVALAEPVVPESAPDEATAVGYARQSGTPVRVDSATSETEELTANPDGTMTYTQHAQPVRVKRDGGWVPVDLTLERRPDGGFAPKAAPVETVFSPGGMGSGAAPLAKISQGSHEVGLGWQRDLPTPTVDGATLTYANVLPDVDLKVEAGIRGFSQVLVVKTREAAQHPELADIAFRTHSKDVTVSSPASAPGQLVALDSRGLPVFGGDASWMWDSSGESDANHTDGPARGDRRAEMAVEVKSDAVAVKPDQDFLRDPSTTYPVVLDPWYWCTNCTKAHHVVVQDSWPTAKNFDNSEGVFADLKAGFVNGTELGTRAPGISRSFVQMNTGAINGKQIHWATLGMKVVHTYSCSPSPTEIGLAGWMDTNTDWYSQPAWIYTLAEVNQRNNARFCPEDGGAEAVVTRAVADAAANNWQLTTFGFRAKDESALDASWRKFDLNPYLQVTYNSYPNTPSDLGMEAWGPNAGDQLPCAVGANRPHVGTATPRLRAKVSDPDRGMLTDTGFLVERGPSGGDVPLIELVRNDIPSESFAEVGIPEGTLVENGLYHWSVYTGDGSVRSNRSGDCEFVVDTVAPNTPLVTSTDYPTTNFNGTVGKTGMFTFEVNGNTGYGGSMDVTRYGWSLNDDTVAATFVNVTAADGKVTVPITPNREGVNVLYVAAYDKANNRSATSAAYTFKVAPPTGPVGEWKLDETAGAVAADTSGGNHPLALSGGAVFGAGYAGNGFVGNGTTAVAATSSAVVDTSRSFSVGAWVKLADTTGAYTVAGQDNASHSSFYLQHAEGRWTMTAAREDGQGYVRAVSTSPSQAGLWTHVLGVYEPDRATVSLYVDGKYQASTTQPLWKVTGSFVVGAARWAGNRANHLPGVIDHVRVWDRVLNAQEAANEANLVVPRARYQLDERTGTTARDEVAGVAATRSGGATWAGSSDVSSASDEKWLAYDNSGTGQVSVPRPALLRTDRSFSVATWVRLGDSAGGARTALSVHDPYFAPFSLGYADGRWKFTMARSGLGAVNTWRALSDHPAVTGQWVHLAATYDAPASRILLYVDGVRQTTFSLTRPDGTGVSGMNTSAQLWIGRDTSGSSASEVWAGDVDDVRVYSGVLDATAVRDVALTTQHF
ncbi:LamG-like jellyroll fold domain-containing protein [Saccharothrix sp.]|uniref:LamG-like jellyroll fold domain-containing protein n=1 Tax=Saccharothrix sp. TaxID=1873460 RepID=UPI0028110BE9|nr:LamG-like jellyroll fold domain-containing protein [Saccharothrix sp.]